MSGDFEHNINQRMQDFRIEPGPQIWERVAAALPQKKRRRFAIWWWLLPVAACLGGSIWLGLRKSNKPANAAMQQAARQIPAVESHHQSTEENTTADIIKNDKKQTVVDVKEAVPNKKQTWADVKQPVPDKQEVIAKQSTKKKWKETAAKKVVNKKIATYQPAIDYAIHQTIETRKNSLLKRQNNYAGNTNAELDKVLNNAAGNIALQKAFASNSAFIDKQSILPVPDLTLIKPQEITDAKDSSVTEKEDTLIATLTQKNTPSAKHTISKTAWSLVFAAGSSSLNSSGQNENKVAYANNLSTGTGFSGNASRQFTNPTGGLNFSAGIIRQHALNKHWSWQAALYYQFLTSHQITGGSNDSLLRFQTFADAAYTIVRLSGNTAGTGNTTGTTSTTGAKRTNQVHRLQIVPGVQFTINPSSTSPISFSAGAAVAYNLGNRLLLHDYRSFSYIRSSKFSNNLLIGAAGGVDVFINRSIHTGIFFTHDFTNVAKPQLQSSFHWNQLQFRVGIPLTKHK